MAYKILPAPGLKLLGVGCRRGAEIDGSADQHRTLPASGINGDSLSGPGPGQRRILVQGRETWTSELSPRVPARCWKHRGKAAQRGLEPAVSMLILRDGLLQARRAIAGCISLPEPLIASRARAICRYHGPEYAEIHQALTGASPGPCRGPSARRPASGGSC